ncbi:protein kinase domain-containing protein [Mailhella sp.]
MKTDTLRHVDEYHNVHFQEQILGQGGQGIVYKTQDPDIALKVSVDASGEPLKASSAIQEQAVRFRHFRRLPLPEKLNIAAPLALLEGEAGYVMQLLNELVPLHELFPSAQDGPTFIPAWLKGADNRLAHHLLHFVKTGGLRRRMLLLFHCSSLLARLHGQGMLYGDLSLNNIFISNDSAQDVVWLIDADNIRFDRENSRSKVWTPWYGAPELIQDIGGNSCSSDCYSFAIVAFQVLSFIHPFRDGELMEDDDWEEKDENISMEDKAMAGLIPWVDDADDESNRCPHGIPRALILTKRLKELFEATLGPGRTDRERRPSIWHWPQAFAQAADTLLGCPVCGMQHYPDSIMFKKGLCPYCGTPEPRYLQFETFAVDTEEDTSPRWTFLRELRRNQEVLVPRRVFGVLRMQEATLHELAVRMDDDCTLCIRRTDHSDLDLSYALEGTPPQPLTTQIKVSASPGVQVLWLYVSSSASRAVRLTIHEGGSYGAP